MSTPSIRKNSGVKRRAQTAERVFQRLVEAIVTGAIPSGGPMREASLAAQWGVSRTPMREAVRRAAEAGLLMLRRNRTPLVRAFTPHDIDCLYQMREVLEILALQQAWDHIAPEAVAGLSQQAVQCAPDRNHDWIDRCLAFDEKLHGCWINACQNPWLTQSLSRIWTFIRIFQRLMARDPALVRRSYEEHCRVLQYLGTKDRRQGIAQLHEHICNSGAAIKAKLEARGDLAGQN